MFRVKGTKLEDGLYHESLIRDVARRDVGAGIILSAVYFEWCIRRSIVVLGTSKVSVLNARFRSERFSFDDIKELWKVEVRPRIGIGLAELYDRQTPKQKFGKLRLTWRDIIRAHDHRNELVHGTHCSPLEDYGKDYVVLLLYASKVLEDLCQEHRTSIFKIIRRK